ncbi:MAG: HNH endonuclease [Acidimicrobiia bacterium]|nr:HNH endonuclease [Acidimicrobiia bacterium]
MTRFSAGASRATISCLTQLEHPPDSRRRTTHTHHLVHWANGGTTSLDNTVLVCRAHHTKLHEHHWTAKLTPEGELEVKPP